MKWKVPYIDLPAQFHNSEKELMKELKRVMATGSFILRDDVRKFEEKMASFLGVDYVVGVNSGTDALFLALKVAGIGSGDEVITVSHTFVATLAAIFHCSATPVLVDINEDFNMNMNQLENVISSRTKAVLPVHLNGRVCNMERLLAIAEEYDLIIIEDAAQALGAEFKEKKAGTFGIAGCFSLHPMKILSAAGDGGFIATDNKEIAENIRILRNHGQKTKEDLICFGYNSRLDNLHASIINVKFKYLEQWIKRRREIAARYHKGLSNLPLVLPPPPSKNDFFDVYTSYVIRSQIQDDLVSYLRERGIEVFIHWHKPLHHQKSLNIKHQALPITEKISREVVSLPIYAEISNEQVDVVVKTIHEFFEKDRT